MVIESATLHTSRLLVDRSKFIHKLLNFSAADIMFTSNFFDLYNKYYYKVVVKLDTYFARKNVSSCWFKVIQSCGPCKVHTAL